MLSPIVWQLLALSAAACSSSDARAPWTTAGGRDTAAPSVVACRPGANRQCGVTLDERDGIVTCYQGSQECTQAGWSACAAGSVSMLALPTPPSGPGTRTLSLGAPADCNGNPCDPACQIFDEVPPEPIQSVVSDPKYDWSVGSLASYPNGLVKKGFTEPCATAFDCQFNTYCKAPTLGSCKHAVCATGDPLDDECNSCVTQICAQDETCCTEEIEIDTCTHDPCERGGYLKIGCNSCVTTICATLPGCCSKSGSWGSDCVAAVASKCGNTCDCDQGETLQNGRCYFRDATNRSWTNGRSTCSNRAADWDLARIDNATEGTFLNSWGAGGGWIGFTDQKAFSSAGTWKWTTGTGSWVETTGAGGLHTNFASGEPAASDECARVKSGTGGKWYGEACSSKTSVFPSLCEGPPTVMKAGPKPPHSWGPSCVARVASTCGAICDTSDPTLTTGACSPWYPGETNPGCSGADLALGPPCEQEIPVCNHGKTAAPAGIKIVHFPANSQSFPTCTPDLGHPQTKVCHTSEPIPPGECITVTGCPGLSGNREIMVNPPGTGQVAECSCQDNWSLFSGGECGAPICAGGSSEASLVKQPVDIVFIIDNSGSLAGEIEAVQDRINEDFATIIGDSGVDYRVIMLARYGDVNIGVGDSNHPICVSKPLGGNDCLNPSLEPLTLNPPRFYHYSTDIGSLDSWCKLLGTYQLPDEQPSGDRAWTARAPGGWSQWLRSSAFKVFVEITDDDVSCSTYGYAFNDLNTVAGGQAAATAFDAELLELDPVQFGTAADRNYVWHSIVAMAPNSPSTSAWPATAAITTSKCTPGSEGPGTGYQALSRLTGGLRYPTCLNSSFNAIFNAIAEQVVEQSSASCDYALPAGDSYDPSQATVTYTTTKNGQDSTVTLDRVSSLSNCTDEGWYYDNPSDPTLIKLCPDACEDIRSDSSARVWVELGCPGTAAPLTMSEVYTGVCPEGKNPVWLDLGYTASLVSDASITLRARVAQSEDTLAAATWVPLRTITDANESCPQGSACALDVFAALGGKPQAHLAVLELEATLTPSEAGDSAVLNDWQISYSCRDDE